jgi:hypothetical protein
LKKLTTQEAEQLIKMLKKTIEKEIYLPSKGTNSQVVYNHDISGTNTPTVDRFSFANLKIDIPNYKNSESLTELTTDEVD